MSQLAVGARPGMTDQAFSRFFLQVFTVFETCHTLVFVGSPPGGSDIFSGLANSPSVVPVTFYSSLAKMKYSIPPGIDFYDTQIGYIFFEEADSHAIIDKMSTVNPQARMIISTVSFSASIVAWRAYKMLNVVTLHNESLCTFNPFLDVLKCGSETEIKHFLDQKLLNLNGYPVTVSIFEDSGSCKRKGSRFVYADGEIGYLMGAAMNYTAVYYTNPDRQKYGFKRDDQNYTGALADVFYGKAEFSSNMRIITTGYNSSFFTYMGFATPLTLSWIVPKDFYHEEFDVFPDRFFDLPTRSLKLFSTLLMTLVYFSCELIETRYFAAPHPEPRMPILKVLLNLNSLLCNVTLAKLPRRSRSRFLLLVFMVMTFIINYSYQGLILTSLNRGSSSADIQRLSQLLDSGLELWVERGLSVFLKPLSEFPPGTDYRRMFDDYKMIDQDNFDPSIRCLQNRTCGFLAPLHIINYFKVATFRGTDTIFMVPETPLRFHQGPLINKTSPYIPRMADLLGRIEASGFVSFGDTWANFNYKLQHIQFSLRNHNPQENQVKLLRLEHLRNVFVYYFIANGVALAVLVAENVVFRVSKLAFFKGELMAKVFRQ